MMRELFLLDPDVIFLNHGSFGACPRPVFEEYQRWQRELERQPVEFLGRRFNDLMRDARSALGDFVGADAVPAVRADGMRRRERRYRHLVRFVPADTRSRVEGDQE